MSSNEVRGKLGLPPKDDERADSLLNKNINKAGEETNISPTNDSGYANEGSNDIESTESDE